MKKGILIFNQSNRRYAVIDPNAKQIITDGLHCGDCLKIYDPATEAWKETSIEMQQEEWYLADTVYSGDLSNIIVQVEE